MVTSWFSLDTSHFVIPPFLVPLSGNPQFPASTFGPPLFPVEAVDPERFLVPPCVSLVPWSVMLLFNNSPFHILISTIPCLTFSFALLSQ